MASDAKDNNSENVEEQVLGPLVFNCARCKTTVGDSFSFMTSNAELKTITLSAASNIQRTNELYTSQEAHDEGSTYFRFMCSGCQQNIGRYYVTTSTDLDQLREKFTFSVDDIASYELGKAQHGSLPAPNTITVADVQESKYKSGDIQPEEIKALQDDMLKVQHVILDLVNRVGDLEGHLKELSGRIAPTYQSNASGIQTSTSLPQQYIRTDNQSSQLQNPRSKRSRTIQ